jgi:uncharacterized membrane protein YphA (DoxX/SURF4 family)
MLARLLATNGDWVLTVARVVLGVAFFVHGSQKLLGWFGGHGLSATVRAFQDQMGIPAPLTYLAIAAEFFGGIGLGAFSLDLALYRPESLRWRTGSPLRSKACCRVAA